MDEPCVQGPDKPYLGALRTMDALMREFVKATIDARVTVLMGGDGDLEEARVQAKARELQAILYGQDDRYTPMPFNRVERLGVYLTETVVDGPPGEAAYYLLMAGANQVISLLLASEREEISEPDLRDALDGLIESFAYRLRGLDPEF